MAIGAVAVAPGLLSGGDKYTLGGGNDSGRQIRTEGSTELHTQGEASAEPTSEALAAVPGPRTKRPQAPTKPSPTPTPTKPSASPSKETTKSPETEKKKEREQKTKSTPPIRIETRAPDRSSERTPSAAGTAKAAEAAVLSMVNAERAKAGCGPVRADAQLAALAGDFSEDMAARDFFNHTDPDGATPWNRAEKAGVSSLGSENIARGQADADSVMNAWMNSDGHRTNILNCDYKTLGVGVHLGAGGPWWTQDFGF
jgi:uncharacterized protein YkwD